MPDLTRIIAATGNPGKLAELRALLAPNGFEITAQAELGVAEVEESGATFAENALLKARNACAHTGLAAIADDSGLEVDALHGAPGVYSARYAGAGACAADNIAKLLRELAAVAPVMRTARFRCELVFLRAADAKPLRGAGVWEGRIAGAPRGDNGFGYDPVFFLDDYNMTAAELGAELKNRMSHRACALRELSAALQRTL